MPIIKKTDKVPPAKKPAKESPLEAATKELKAPKPKPSGQTLAPVKPGEYAPDLFRDCAPEPRKPLPRTRRETLTPAVAKWCGKAALPSCYKAGASGYLTKILRSELTPVNPAYFRTELNKNLTNRFACALADLKRHFGANFFSRCGETATHAWNIDAGILKGFLIMGYVRVNPKNLLNAQGKFCPETSNRAEKSGATEFYITLKGLKLGLGADLNAWANENLKNWDGKSAAYRAGIITEKEEAAEGK